jgi:anti-sigma B factor antagonist
MEFKVTKERGVCLVNACRELDATAAPDFNQKLESLLTDGKQKIVIDLKDTRFIDSSGLATLVRAFKRARAAGGALALAGLQPAVLKIFELTRLDRAFDIYRDRNEALAHLGG